MDTSGKDKKGPQSTLSIITRLQLLDVMLGSIQGRDGASSQYAILYLDGFTTQILSNICGISDLLDYGISLVDNINNTKPTKQDKVFFVTPTDANVSLLTTKHKHSSNVHVFFTTAPSPFQLEDIKKSSQLLSHLVTLKEANVEFVMNPDSRGFTTGPEDALARFYGHGAELQPGYDEEMYLIANRLASLFVTMKEMPSIRYRAALPPESHEYPHGLESRLLVTQRLAVEVSTLLEQYQETNQIPEGETCELIIVDRGMDAVAPIVHEWTYESMIYDLLSSDLTEGRNVYQGHVLNDKDAMFVKLRHCHFAEASSKITEYCDELQSKNGGRGRNQNIKDMDLKSMAKLVRNLPKYQDELRSLNVHVDIASALNKRIDGGRLTEFGALEQDVIFGNANSKELISFLSSNQLMSESDKLRLLLCYSATHLEKLDETRQSQWQKLARLDASEVKCLRNLEYLGVPVCKREGASLSSSMSFGKVRRKKSAVRYVPGRNAPDLNAGTVACILSTTHPFSSHFGRLTFQSYVLYRRERNVFGMNSDTFSLARFVPVLAEKLEDQYHCRLSEDEFPYVKPPSYLTGSPQTGNSLSSDSHSYQSQHSQHSQQIHQNRDVRSVASFRTKGGGKAEGSSLSSFSTPSKHRPALSGKLKTNNGRVFIFVIGGFTYSELRLAHHMSETLDKDVFVGGTSLLRPLEFIDSLKSLA